MTRAITRQDAAAKDLALATGLTLGAILAVALIAVLTWWILAAQLDLAVDRTGLLATVDLVDGGPGWKGGGAVLSLDVAPRQAEGRWITPAAARRWLCVRCE